MPEQDSTPFVLPPTGSAGVFRDPKPWWHYQTIVLSATQLDMWELCQRKWAWRYIEGLKGSNRFAQKGIEIDEKLTAWLEKGTPIDGASEIGQIVMPGLKYLPVPGTPTLSVQHEFHIQTPVAVYYGKKDFQWVENGLPIVGDNKSTVSFQWAHSEESLGQNTQALLYAADAVSHYGTDSCELRWVYYRTRGSPASKQTRLRIFRSEIEERMDRIDETAKQIIEAYKAMPDATDLSIDPRSCEAYGGCPYKDNCNLSSLQRMKALMAQENKGQTLVEKMRANALAKAKAAAEAPTAAATAPAGAALPAAAPISGTKLIDRIAQRAAEGVNPPQVEEQVPLAPPMPDPAPAAVAPAAEAAAPSDTPARRGRPRGSKAAPAADAAPVAASGEADNETDIAVHVARIAASARALRSLGVPVTVTYDF